MTYEYFLPVGCALAVPLPAIVIEARQSMPIVVLSVPAMSRILRPLRTMILCCQKAII